MSRAAINSLNNKVAKWIAMDCRPIYIVEDEGLLEVLQSATKDPNYKLPCRKTTLAKITKMYDNEKKSQL